MTKNQIDNLSYEIAKNVPHTITCIKAIPAILNYLNNKGLLHPLRDDTFLWDKDVVEQEYPNVVKQIRAEEREKVIREVKDKINEVGHVL